MIKVNNQSNAHQIPSRIPFRRIFTSYLLVLHLFLGEDRSQRSFFCFRLTNTSTIDLFTQYTAIINLFTMQGYTQTIYCNGWICGFDVHLPTIGRSDISLRLTSTIDLSKIISQLTLKLYVVAPKFVPFDGTLSVPDSRKR